MKIWDKMAKRYPHYDDASMRSDVAYILGFAEQKGVCFEHQEILDVGAGTGTISIPLALKGAKHITAIDPSSSMLKILQQDVLKTHVHHQITTHLSDWDSFGLTQTYDIVIASMTPAIACEKDIEKLLCATRNIGIYVCWGDYKINYFVDTLLQRHEVTPENKALSPMNMEKFTLFLDAQSIRYETTTFETTWEDTFCLEQAKEYALEHLERRAIIPRMSIIEAMLEEYAKDGFLKVQTKAQKNIVIFFTQLHKNIDSQKVK